MKSNIRMKFKSTASDNWEIAKQALLEGKEKKAVRTINRLVASDRISKQAHTIRKDKATQKYNK